VRDTFVVAVPRCARQPLDTFSTVDRTSHAYLLNNANQRTKRTDADGSYWDYGYDSLGQVTNAVRYWAAVGTNAAERVIGQSYSYLFDGIGNRKSSGIGVPPVQSEYTANLLNQNTQRTVSGFIDILGSAASNATVAVNGTTAGRQGEYFRHELALAKPTPRPTVRS